MAVNSQIEMEKLEFHTPDVNGKSKCHTMHIGKENLTFPALKKRMVKVTEDTYPGLH